VSLKNNDIKDLRKSLEEARIKHFGKKGRFKEKVYFDDQY